LKILIAEDDAVSRTVLKRTVEKFGHECLAAKDGLEAWEMYRDTPDVEVIISDWMMPNMDGLEFCHKVRGLDRPGYTFFVFLTALGGKEKLLEGMLAGADEYLTKPLDGEQLRVKLITASRVTSLHKHLREEESAQTATRADDKGAREDRGGMAVVPGQPKTRVGQANIWEILLAQNKVTEEQLQQALEAQKGERKDLGRVLLSLGFISESDFAKAQAQRLKLSYVDLDETNVDHEAVGLVPEKLLRKHEMLPLRTENGRLVVAMSDPTDVYALDDLRMVAGCPILPVVVTDEDLQRTLNNVFATVEQVADVLAEAVEDDVEDSGDFELGVEAGPEEAPVVRIVNSVLQRAVSEGASDVHLEPQAREVLVRLRVDGVLRKLMSIPSGLQSGVTARLKIMANLDIAEHRVPQDGRFSVSLGEKKVDLRVAVLPTVYGQEAVLRLLDTSGLQTDLAKLGFAPRDLERYEEVFKRPYGTILVTGPTGSGKSTTLYSTLGELNTPQKKIITVEDPVEYRIRGINQVQVNPKIGLTFASGLRSILRNDPDIVMIGEIRDPETAKTSVEAALTGHLVLATLHTNNAPAAVARLTEMGVEPYLTASAVDCVIAQRLARRLCDRCKQPVKIEKEILASMRFPFEHFTGDEPRFHKAVGCRRCGDTGYRGRVGLYELMVGTEEIRDMVVRGAPVGEVARAAEKGGMVRLRDDGLLKAADGVTTIEEVLRTVV
jgi:type IV pilus assembly protein PilB